MTCARGHELTDETFYIRDRSDGRSQKCCRACDRERARARYVPGQSGVRYRQRQAAGLCPSCGQRPPMPKAKKCAPCLRYQRIWHWDRYGVPRSLREA